MTAGDLIGWALVGCAGCVVAYVVCLVLFHQLFPSRIADHIHPMPVPSPPQDAWSRHADEIHSCANCGTRFHHGLTTAVFNVGVNDSVVPYCSTACAESMPFLPDREALEWARSMRAIMERQYPRRAPSAYEEAIRARRAVERQIAEESRRVDNEMRRLRLRYNVASAGDIARITQGQRRPSRYTGQEPEDL